MKKLNFIFFLLCFSALVAISFAAKSQSDSAFQFIKTIKGKYTSFTVDNLDNIYLITATNQLKKINGNGDSAGVFNDVKRFGALTAIDVTNPLKILLYYKSFATVVVLDRFLNTRNTINFRKQNIFSVQSITTSYDNNIWLFDEQDYKLKKIDDDGRLLQETTDFRMLFDSVPSPGNLVDKDNFVYLYDTAKGFYIFDYYGAFKNRLPFLNWSNIAVSAKNMYGFSNSKLYSYELQSLTLKEYQLPGYLAGYNAIKAANGKLYLLKDDGVYIYQVK
ncbi:hypothetical protein [Ferruginibacter sp.]|nr:hypothetical protein [Ferruginibacter sp.]